MTPTDFLKQLSPDSDLKGLLCRAAPAEVRAAIDAIPSAAVGTENAAALAYARGALALRGGSLEVALTELEAAAAQFEKLGHQEAAQLSRCEKWVAAIRRGPAKVYQEAIDDLVSLTNAAATPRVSARALHYHATALRFAGRAEETLTTLLEALDAGEGMPSERAKILNSLGTLYVVMGMFGAAESTLEHAAELNAQIRDRVSEAISHGQLGAAAYATGDFDRARHHLQRQEWLATDVGDAFGRARALCMLADVALSMGRADNAVELAEGAREVAESVEPPLSIWLGYASRIRARALLDLGDDPSDAFEQCRTAFAATNNRLGMALNDWDRAVFEVRRHDADSTVLFEPAWQLADLGLRARVCEVIASATGASPTLMAALAQPYRHLSAAEQSERAVSDASWVRAVGARTMGAHRNAARLAALSLSRAGLWVTLFDGHDRANGGPTLPPRGVSAACAGEMAGVVLWVWPGDLAASDLGVHLANIAGAGARVVVRHVADARVVGVPFSGEVGAMTRGVDALALMVDLGRLEAGQVSLGDSPDAGGMSAAFAPLMVVR